MHSERSESCMPSAYALSTPAPGVGPRSRSPESVAGSDTRLSTH